MQLTFLGERSPSVEAYWRAIILFGRNSACYKFALAQTLLECLEKEQTLVSLEELAAPFARHVTRHLASMDKQGTSSQSQFLEVCRQFNAGQISDDELARHSVRLGFVNVIDAFHVVNQRETPLRFFVDDRRSHKGITLTDSLLALRNTPQGASLQREVEARWRLVETAWVLDMARHSLQVRFDGEKGLFFTESKLRRQEITSCRDALNGYQKGQCFYCFTDLSLQAGADNLADVDHFFPWSLQQLPAAGHLYLDGVWNLVLSCASCNRGQGGKFALVPELRFLERLHRRNTFLIESHHPLRETLIAQTGRTQEQRAHFLGEADALAIEALLHRWKPLHEYPAAF